MDMKTAKTKAEKIVSKQDSQRKNRRTEKTAKREERERKKAALKRYRAQQTDIQTYEEVQDLPEPEQQGFFSKISKLFKK